MARAEPEWIMWNSPFCSLIEKLQEEAKGKKLVEEKLAKAEQEKKNLERVDLDWSRTLEAGKGLKELLKAQDEEELDDAKIPFMKGGCEEFYALIRQDFNHFSANSAYPQLKVSECFKLSILFNDWFREFDASATPSKSKFAFLFASFPDRDDCALEIWKVLAKWDIQIGEAVDEGGVSREFLNQVWLQLGDLRVELPGRTKVDLFEKTKGGLLPSTNEELLQHQKYMDEAEADEFKNRFECYYRAIGRILAHSILLSPEDFGPVPVASHALPLLYRSGKRWSRSG
jgi:hypothetical protein